MKFYFTIVSLFIYSALSAQSWQEVVVDDIPFTGKKVFQVEQARLYQIDDETFKETLWSAPHEDDVKSGNTQGILVSFMLADGTTDLFYVCSYDMMEPELALKYPDIKTFIGISRQHADRKIRIDYTDQGVRAVITDKNGKTYIDHYQRGDKNHRIVYKRSDYKAKEKFSCEFQTTKDKNIKESNSSLKQLLGECELKTYRYAQTATGEYSNYHGASSSAQSSLVLSAITTTMNRVNEVYEQDLTVRFVLIANTDDIFYYNPSTDPFTGNNAGSMINQNQTNTDNVIGAANYDIGHIFSTGGSGLAGLGVVCSGGSKARGVTGIATPEGDPFDIDYVAHEIGHQCGGNHTQNNSCNRSGTSVEVGSGFTIMGYAGICEPNVLDNSIAMFNVANIIEMTNYLSSRTCHATVATGNSAPVALPVDDKIIPHSTPFVLDIEVSDSDGDALFHTWEQQDAEVATMPPVSTNTGGPTFRAYLPETNSARYFPRLSDLTQGTSFQWEVLPSVSRELNFAYTARDISFATGCIDTATVSLTVDGSAGPFDVTSQTTSVTFNEYENVVVEWDVASTNVGSINAKIVDILYSRDGGFTYPDTLVKQTRNDGVREVVIPQGLENDARFMVKASDNYFFDINAADLSVVNSGPSYTLSLDQYYENFCSNSEAITVGINAQAWEGFSGTINLSIANIPAGYTATLDQNTISETGSTFFTLDGFSGTTGEFVLDIIGESGGVTRTQEFYFIVSGGGSTTTLTAPVQAAVDIVNNPLLEWESVTGAVSYDYEVINSGGIVVATGSSSSTSTIVSSVLGIDQTYEWRVRPVFSCGPGAFTNTNSFSTATCFNYIERTDVVIPTTISTVSSTINVPFSGTISDVNIKDLDITHSWIEDLDVSIENPLNTSVLLYDNTCGQDDDILLSYDDAGTAFNCNIRTSGSTVQPVGALSTFNNTDLSGEWELVISDVANQDGGTLNSWTLEVCFVSDCDLEVDKITYDDGAGSLKNAIDCASPGDEITFSTALGMTPTINLNTERIVLSKSLIMSGRNGQVVTLLNSSSEALLEVLASQSLTLNNIVLENTTTVNEVVKNSGTLNMNNVEINAGSSADGLLNTNGSINVTGSNSLQKN